LIQEDVKLDKPEDIHYVFSGLAPLSVRLIEMMMNLGGFNRIKEQLKLLPGNTVSPDNEADFFKETQRKKRILVYFIGGVTFAEIAALRFLNTLFPDKKFIVATTSIINGNSCMQQMRTAKDNNLDLTQLK
jgi:hypothetical protein